MIRILALLFPVLAAGETCSLTGRVTDDRGTPIPFAAVTVWRWPAQVGGAAAGKDGLYCIQGLPPGAYSLHVTHRATPPSASPSCRECCDSTTEFAPARTPNATVGPRARYDIRLRRVAAYCVPGEIRDAKGRLREDVAISIARDSQGSGAVINEGGRFLLTALPPGAYTLTVQDHPQLGRILARRVIHVRSSNLAGQVIIIE